MTKVSKSEWQTYRFDKIAKEIKDRVEIPSASGFDRYVGLTHLDPGSLKIRRWGSTKDVEKTKMLFKSGDIIFGRRNAYLRRVSIADFDGVCSAHAMVLRAQSDVVLPEFFPFFLQTDSFWRAALRNSAGSLSPTINWSNIAKEEFALPSLEEQRRMADVLQAIQLTGERVYDTWTSLECAEESLFRSLLSGNGITKSDKVEHDAFGLIPRDWPLISMSEVADVAYGISAAVASNKDPSIGWPILTGANISLDGFLDTSKLVYYPEPTKSSFILKKGDVLLNWRSGSKAHVGKAALFDLEGDWTYASFILRVRAGDGLNNLFLWRLLNYMRKHELFGRSTTQQVNFKMNAAYFRAVEIPVPSKKVQDKIVAHMRLFWAARTSIENRMNRLKTMGQAFFLDGEITT